MDTAFAGFGVNRAWVVLTEGEFLRNVFRVLFDVVSESGQFASGAFACADETDFNNIAFFSHFSNFLVRNSAAKISILLLKSRKTVRMLKY